uniref:5'-3' DNA helicase ZGRF1-like N-terminal domain-containing protein n=3 Tax=Rhizophora mucronata TaxID=61149 RepID=A0A2P2LLD3_RHIMU
MNVSTSFDCNGRVDVDTTLFAWVCIQIMIYDSSRKLLETKFLRKDETVESGKSMAFDAHLVEIGELEDENRAVTDFNMQRNNFNVSGKARILYGDQNNLTNNKPVMEGMGQSNAGLTRDTDSSSTSSANRTKLCQTVPSNKHLRDAQQILAILQKAKAPDYVVPGCDDMTAHSSSVKRLQVSDADLDMSESSQLLGESFPNQGPAEGGDITGSSETGFEVLSTSMCSQLQNNSETGNSDQSQLNNMEATTTTKQFSSARSSSAGAQALYSLDDKKGENFQQLNHGEEMDECPTFDLGF